MPDLSTIFLSVTLILACFSHLISSTRLVHRWRFRTRLPRTLDFSATASYPDQHPKRFLWELSLFILFSSTPTAALAILTITQNGPYATVLAAWIIVACCFHEAMISVPRCQISMDIFKPLSVWSALVIACGLLLVGVVLQLLDLCPYGLVLAKLPPGCYRVYFIWEWINYVLRDRPDLSKPNSSPKGKISLMARFVLTIPSFMFVFTLSDDYFMATAATYTVYDVFLNATVLSSELRQSSEARVELKAQVNEHTSQHRHIQDEDLKNYPLSVTSNKAPDSVRSQVTGVLEPHSVV